jgi:HD-GYP domain-containing protein (c-di-GMP phosphodiesterase class II)
MINRVKQVINYIFNKPKIEEIEKIKLLLTKKEYKIFMNMDNYDKVHSLDVYQMVKADDLLNKNEKYLKLALLHDCGKETIGLLTRMKKVLVGDKLLDRHPRIGYKKLKELDLELADLILNHHGMDVDKKLKRFQEIDDKS